jgi:hypothetical protein
MNPGSEINPRLPLPSLFFFPLHPATGRGLAKTLPLPSRAAQVSEVPAGGHFQTVYSAPTTRPAGQYKRELQWLREFGRSAELICRDLGIGA